MSVFIGLPALLAAGWLLARRAGLGRGDALHDVSLGWFVGSGYFALAYVIAIALGNPVRPPVSLVIISLPFLLLLKGGGEDWRAFRASVINTGRILRGSGKALLPGLPLILLAAVAVAVMALQGISTPPVSDDVVRVRLAEPIGQYFTTAVPLFQCFQNGIWPNYVPQLFWHIGGLDFFTIQYLVLFTVVFALLLVFQALLLEQRPAAAAYALFMPAALPFFVFHGTVSHLDILAACFFGLGFFFFQLFAWKGEENHLYASIIFFTLTILSKNSSETLTFIGLGFLAAAVAARAWRGGPPPAKKVILFILPLLIYFVLKEIARPSPSQVQFLAGQPVTASSPYITHHIGEGTGAVIKWSELLAGIRYSLFSSGHFGILFYALVLSVAVFFGKIFRSRHIWGLGLLAAVLGSMMMYYLFLFNDPLAQQAQINRALLTPAVAAALFLAMLWGDEAG